MITNRRGVKALKDRAKATDRLAKAEERINSALLDIMKIEDENAGDSNARSRSDSNEGLKRQKKE